MWDDGIEHIGGVNMDEYDLELILEEYTEDLIEFEIPYMGIDYPDDDMNLITEEELLLLLDTTESL